MVGAVGGIITENIRKEFVLPQENMFTVKYFNRPLTQSQLRESEAQEPSSKALTILLDPSARFGVVVT